MFYDTLFQVMSNSFNMATNNGFMPNRWRTHEEILRFYKAEYSLSELYDMETHFQWLILLFIQ